MIKRWLEDLIKSDLKKGKTVLLIGSRRAGKTTLAKMIEPREECYFTLDDTDILQTLQKDPKTLLRWLKKDRLTILDEAQKAPFLMSTLKLAIDDGYSFLLTGSSTLGLLEQASETLAGRIRIRECPTLIWGETHGKPKTYILHASPENWIEDIDLRHTHEGLRDFRDVFEYGGYPEVVTAPPEERFDLLKDYRNTYLQRDILELANIHHLDKFRALCGALAQSIGTPADFNQFSQESGLSYITTKKYLHAFEQTFIAFKVYPYAFGPAKRYIKSSKWFFSDQGMLRSLGFELSKGALFENFVIQELRKHLAVAGEETAGLFFYKSTSGAEVDLIVETDRMKFAFEIKASQTLTPKSFKNLKKLLDTDRSIQWGALIYLGNDIQKIDRSLYVLPISVLFQTL